MATTPDLTTLSKMTMDLNLDAGESEADLLSGKEEALYRLVSSVNIACGGHTGTIRTMRMAVELAKANGLVIGAHPSYPDRAGFGRERIQISSEALLQSLMGQMESLRSVCFDVGVELRHVKPHGALYNGAATSEDLAQVVLDAVQMIDSRLVVVGLAGSRFLELAKGRGLRCAGEAFVDRRYEANGSLRSRKLPRALIEDPAEAAAQALAIARGEGIMTVDGSSLTIHADTLCIHGDSPRSLPVARRVREELERHGVVIKPFGSR